MSRSGYNDEIDNWALIKWRGQVASAIRGQRGQRLLRDTLAALDAMWEKRLVASELETTDGEVCTLGAVGQMRGLDLSEIDPEDYELVASKFDIAEPLAREIVYENDECGRFDESPEQRWARMREWVVKHINFDESHPRHPKYHRDHYPGCALASLKQMPEEPTE